MANERKLRMHGTQVGMLEREYWIWNQMFLFYSILPLTDYDLGQVTQVCLQISASTFFSH